MTPRFLSKLRFEDDGGFPFTLLEPLVYVTAAGRRIVVPTRFATDLASIPRLLWNVLPPIGRYDAAAVVHDYLYRQPAGAPVLTRQAADGLLSEAMGVLGVVPWQRWAIVAGVRVGGWVTWNRYRSAKAGGILSAKRVTADNA